jgi:hypothetical protein
MHRATTTICQSVRGPSWPMDLTPEMDGAAIRCAPHKWLAIISACLILSGERVQSP